MAGGEGSRFYPLSTPERPKQFLNFIDDKTFIRQTFERITPIVDPANIYISTNERYFGLVKEELPEIQDDNIIIEPLKKNTGPALAYATMLIKLKHGESIICCLPSDHYISNETGFRTSIRSAANLAMDGYIVTLGMKPSWSSTEYGYISAINPNSEWSEILAFKEKPNKDMAQEYLNKGYFWNGGIFVWSTKVFFDEMALHANHLIPKTTQIDNDFCRKYFENAQAISIDYALMEKSKKVAVIPTAIGWNDVGTWESIKRLHQENVNISKRVVDIMYGDGIVAV